jgi:hypothetical protein
MKYTEREGGKASADLQIEIEGGALVLIRDFVLYRNTDGQTYVNPPTHRTAGGKLFSPFQFADRAARMKFRTSALDAVSRFLSKEDHLLSSEVIATDKDRRNCTDTAQNVDVFTAGQRLSSTEPCRRSSHSVHYLGVAFQSVEAEA